MKTRLMSVAILALLIAAGLTGLSGGTASANDDACEYAQNPIVAAGDGVTKGTSRADVIVAYTDNNVIYAGAGNDLICSYGQNNVIYGGSGADEIYFYVPEEGYTNGTAYGESGNDYISIIHSVNFADGGSGNDVIDFLDVNEIRGGSGSDQINGNGAGHIYANDGNDRISVDYVFFLDCGTGRDTWGSGGWVFNVTSCERYNNPG